MLIYGWLWNRYIPALNNYQLPVIQTGSRTGFIPALADILTHTIESSHFNVWNMRCNTKTSSPSLYHINLYCVMPTHQSNATEKMGIKLSRYKYNTNLMHFCFWFELRSFSFLCVPSSRPNATIVIFCVEIIRGLWNKTFSIKSYRLFIQS